MHLPDVTELSLQLKWFTTSHLRLQLQLTPW